MTNAMYKFESAEIRQGKLERLRDEFAMHAMQAIIMLEGINQKPESCDADLKKAYMYADAALKAREIK